MSLVCGESVRICTFITTRFLTIFYQCVQMSKKNERVKTVAHMVRQGKDIVNVSPTTKGQETLEDTEQTGG